MARRNSSEKAVVPVEPQMSRMLQMPSMPQYWVVGAMWDGHNDQFEEFIQEGYWLLGWSEDEQPVQIKRRDGIRPDDRIAIKKIGSPNTKIEIRAIGIVSGIDPEDHRVSVRWLMSDLHHQVPSKGCYASIHGPFPPGDEWTRQVFLLEQMEHLLGKEELPDLDCESRLAQEGARRWRLHLVIERNRRNVERKKASVKKEKGSLECEACGFNFARFYGELGADYCEVHHNLQLSQVDAPVRPKLEDLAIVCSNCHRMIHKTDPLMSVENFRLQLKRGAL